jgi:acyl carrier protein
MTTVRETIRTILQRYGAASIAEDTALGEGGLALDSIAVAEVLLECENAFGVSAAPLIDGQPVTLRRMAGYWEPKGR